MSSLDGHIDLLTSGPEFMPTKGIFKSSPKQEIAYCPLTVQCVNKPCRSHERALALSTQHAAGWSCCDVVCTEEVRYELSATGSICLDSRCGRADPHVAAGWHGSGRRAWGRRSGRTGARDCAGTWRVHCLGCVLCRWNFFHKITCKPVIQKQSLCKLEIGSSS